MSVRNYLGRPIMNTSLTDKIQAKPQDGGDSAQGVIAPYDYPSREISIPKPEWQQVAPAPEPGKTEMITDTSGMKSTGAVQTLENNPQVSPAINERVSKGESIYDILASMGRPVDYAAEQRKLERERKGALLGDLAGLVGDSLGLAFGSRQFHPRQSATTQVNGKIQRLQDFKRADDVNYHNQKLSAKYKDYEIAREQQITDSKLTYQKYKDDIENGKWGADMKLKVERLNRDLSNDKISQEKWAKEFKEAERQRSIVNSQGERKIAIAGRNAETSRMNAESSKRVADAKVSGGISSKSNAIDSITVKDGDGRPKRIDYPKHMNAALTPYLYNRMKEIIGNNPSEKRTIEDIQMQFGEGGDQSSKMNAIVKRRISEFPELIPEMEQIIRDGSSDTPKVGNLLPGGNKASGSLLPK